MATLNRRAPPRLALWRPEAAKQEATGFDVVRQLEGALDRACAAREDLRHRDNKRHQRLQHKHKAGGAPRAPLPRPAPFPPHAQTPPRRACCCVLGLKACLVNSSFFT